MENRTERSPQINRLKEMGSMLIGIPFLCNPQLIADFLHNGLRNMYANLITTGNEKNEVLRALHRIPDGMEREVAQYINNVADIAADKKRRSLNKKGSGKPHHSIVTAIKVAETVLTRNRPK